MSDRQSGDEFQERYDELGCPLFRSGSEYLDMSRRGQPLVLMPKSDQMRMWMAQVEDAWKLLRDLNQGGASQVARDAIQKAMSELTECQNILARELYVAAAADIAERNPTESWFFSEPAPASATGNQDDPNPY